MSENTSNTTPPTPFIPSAFIHVSSIASFVNKNKWDFVTPFLRLWQKLDPCDYSECEHKWRNANAFISPDMLNDIVSVFGEAYVSDTLKQGVTLNDLPTRSVEAQAVIEANANLPEANKESLKTAVDALLNAGYHGGGATLPPTQDKTEELKSILGETFVTDTQNNTETISDMTQKIKESHSVIESLEGVTDQKKEALKKNAISLANTSLGNKNENTALELYAKKTKVPMESLDISQTYHKIPLVTTPKFTWYVGGKLDAGIRRTDAGVSDPTPTAHYTRLVEVKTRTRCFFKDVRDYENIQMQMYMHIHNVDLTDLVEFYSGKIKITPVKKSKRVIKETLKDLTHFIDRFETFLDKSLEEKYAFFGRTQEDKAEYLMELYDFNVNYES